MTRYRKIREMQSPFEEDDDEAGRSQWTFNIEMEKEPSSTTDLEIVGLLVAAGLGAYNQVIFIGQHVVLPSVGTVVTVVVTSGATGLRIQNKRPVATERPHAQIRVRAQTRSEALTRIRQAFNALVVVENQDVAVP